jgi:hypothetical protein
MGEEPSKNSLQKSNYADQEPYAGFAYQIRTS